MEEQSRALADGIEATLQGWVERCVERVQLAQLGKVDPGLMVAAADAGRRARAEIVPLLRDLLDTDIDRQWTSPLALLRQTVAYPTGVLRAAGVPSVDRDDFSRDRFPEDHYDLTPASFADVDPSLVELGIAWGAAKAWAHKQRHGTARAT